MGTQSTAITLAIAGVFGDGGLVCGYVTTSWSNAIATNGWPCL